MAMTIPILLDMAQYDQHVENQTPSSKLQGQELHARKY